MEVNGVTLVLIEDDLVDAEAIQRAFRRQKIANPFVVFADGVDALKALRDEPGVIEIPRPYIVLLDINMPRMNGLEMLRRVREDELLHDTIVFVLTTSNDDQDKFEAYNLNVAGYMLKSDMGNSFVRAVSLVDNYWKVVEFPQARAAG
jgi:CheY-like chemotaxis protein